jgi:hypothetical protein
MEQDRVQISAFVSGSTKRLVESYTEANGVKKAYLVEQALLHHMQALAALPADVIIPPRLVVSRSTGEEMLRRIEEPSSPTKAMRELFAETDS